MAHVNEIQNQVDGGSLLALAVPIRLREQSLAFSSPEPYLSGLVSVAAGLESNGDAENCELAPPMTPCSSATMIQSHLEAAIKSLANKRRCDTFDDNLKQFE